MRAHGVQSKGLLEWRSTLEEWIAKEEYERVLCLLAEWDERDAEWWTHFGELLERIPTDLLERHPRLVLRSALPALWAGREADAFAIQKRAEELLPPELNFDAMISRANLYMTSRQYVAADRIYRRILDGSTDLRHRLHALNGLALTALAERFDVEAAGRCFAELASGALEAGVTGHYLVALINRCWHIEIPTGRFFEARSTAEKIAEMRGDSTHSPFYRMCATFNLGMLEYHLGGAQTVDYLSQAYEMARAQGIRTLAVSASGLLADHHASMGAAELARDWIRNCEQLVGHDELGETVVHLAMARLAVASGSSATVNRLVALARSATHTPEVAMLAAVEEAWLLLAQGEVEEAASCAQAAATACEAYGMAFLATRARLAQCAASPAVPRLVIERMLRTADERGYDSLLTVRERDAATPVLIRAFETRSHPEYARALLESMGVASVRVQTLGGMRLAVRNQDVHESAWKRPKARALFAYLLLRESRQVPCEQVEAALWPNQAEVDARNSLRVAASYVRRALGTSEGPGLTLDGRTVRLDLGQCRWRDDEEFLRAAASLDAHGDAAGEAELQECLRALALATGECLPEYAEEPWAAHWRERFAQSRRGMRQHAAELALRLGKPEVALQLAEELLAEEPTHEEGALAALKALDALGRKTDARLLAQRFAHAWTGAKLEGLHPVIRKQIGRRADV